MTIRQMHEGGLNPFLFNQNGRDPQGLPKCDLELAVVNHNAEARETVIKKIGQTDFNSGCECKDCEPLAIGDVVTLGVVPGGSMLTVVQWDLIQPDPTLLFDLEMRKVATIATAGQPIATGFGPTVIDGAVDVNQFFSKYGTPCVGKDCNGKSVNGKGYDHGIIVMVVKALPTGGTGGCNIKCNPFGSLKFDLRYEVFNAR